MTAATLPRAAALVVAGRVAFPMARAIAAARRLPRGEAFTIWMLGFLCSHRALRRAAIGIGFG